MLNIERFCIKKDFVLYCAIYSLIIFNVRKTINYEIHISQTVDNWINSLGIYFVPSVDSPQVLISRCGILCMFNKEII